MCGLEKVIVLILVVTIVTCQNVPPQITTPFKDMYYIVEKNQEKVTFTCSATGSPKPRYEWYKDGNKVQNSLQVTVDETTGDLSILAAELADFGKYQCHAINSMGTALSVEFNLERAFIGTFTDQVPKNLDPIQEYKTVSLECTGKPECVPATDCKVEWKRGEGTTNTVNEDDRIAIDAEGTLHFLNVRKFDESTPSIPYACGINNEMMKAFYKGANVIMPVTAVTNPTQYKPVVKFATQDIKGLKDGQAELQCVFSGYPLPDIEWYTPNDRLISASTKYSFPNGLVKRNLVINQLSQDDEGTYRCVGINMLGKVETNVYLNVTSKPTFLNKEDQLESKTIPSGENVIFTCRMSSLKGERQPSAPTWRRNGALLPESQIGSDPSQKYQLSADKTELTIKNVQKPGDTCSIMCETGNVIFDMNGKDRYIKNYADATLRIIDPINVQVLSDFVIEVNEPKDFWMAVSATTDPSVSQLNYEWTLISSDNKTVYNNAQLRSEEWVSFNDDRTNLTIMPAKFKADNDDDKVRGVVGMYSVRIFHTYDSETREFQTYTNIKPKPIPQVTSAGFDLWIIGLILGIIVLFIVVFFIICTLYRNRGGEYPVDKKEVAAGHDPEQELKDSGFADLSRADGDKTPYDKISLTDDVKPLESDEDSILGDYDDDQEMTKFNEDGSFIGQYMDKKGLLHG